MNQEDRDSQEAGVGIRSSRLNLSTYVARTGGMLITLCYVGATYYERHVALWAWCVLLVHALVFPHAAFFCSRFFRYKIQSYPFELRVQFVESMMAGTYIGMCSLSPWPTAACIVGTMSNNILVGGPKQLMRCFPPMTIVAGLTYTLTGQSFILNSSLPISLFCAAFVAFYVALTTTLTFGAQKKLTQQSKQLRAAKLTAEAQAEKLAELDQQKTAFFQNMSHELRTPLTLILNPLEEEAQAQPQNKNLEVATRNARRLLRLVNQLLDFQKLQAGKQELSLKPVDLNRFVYICGDYFHSACSTKGVTFSVHRDGHPVDRTQEPLWMMGDVDALEKVAFNYLSNALKYTPKSGSIELGLTQNSGTTRIFVKDTGSGISQTGQSKLFQVFSQVDATTSRAYEGTGLGLALVKSLTEEMSGTVGVASEPGQGSTFWAEFPVCDAPKLSDNLNFEVKRWLIEENQGKTGIDDTGVFKALENVPKGSAELVLVVDDLADMRELIANSLNKRNYRVVTAPNGKRGVEIARELKPNLIITDWMMPLMTGPELIETIKGDDALKSVPIVLLTAKSDEESKFIGTKIGADSFLGKPFNDQELGGIVRNLLSLKSREKEVEELNHLLTETVLKRYISPTLVDKIIAGEISMDKPAEMRNITVLFSDLSGFTRTSEILGPRVISAYLNEYLTRMNDIIFEHGGTIDKFIGDAIMVMFGAPVDMPAQEQANRAAACARAMQKKMEIIAKAWETEGAGHLRIRIGLHQGEAIVGNFGSDKRSDYTCIGPTVNLAARIESACEPGEVYLSSAMNKLLDKSSTVEVGEFQMKGIDGQRILYRLTQEDTLHPGHP